MSNNKVISLNERMKEANMRPFLSETMAGTEPVEWAKHGKVDNLESFNLYLKWLLEEDYYE